MSETNLLLFRLNICVLQDALTGVTCNGQKMSLVIELSAVGLASVFGFVVPVVQETLVTKDVAM